MQERPSLLHLPAIKKPDTARSFRDKLHKLYDQTASPKDRITPEPHHD